MPGLARGQMFSADRHNYGAEGNTPAIGIYVGLEPMDFSYQGNDGDNFYEFKGSILRLALESNGVELFMGTGGNITGLDDYSYFDAGIKFGYGLPIYFTRQVFLQIPLQLQSTLTSVSRDNIAVVNAQQFEEGAFGLGTGLDMNATLATNFRVGASVIPSYSFAFSTRERDASGAMFGVEGKARFYFDHLVGNAGLSLGYTYDFRQYDISGQTLDYNAMGHTVLIGVTF